MTNNIHFQNGNFFGVHGNIYAASVYFYWESTSKSADGLFTNLSLEPTWRWYFHMTPFETFFLGVILAQIALLNTIGILPLSLSSLLKGDPAGRRRKRSLEAVKSQGGNSTTSTFVFINLLKLLTKLDENKCTFKGICVIGWKIEKGEIQPQRDSIKFTVDSLYRLYTTVWKSPSQGKFDNTTIPIYGEICSEVNDALTVLKDYCQAANNGFLSAVDPAFYNCTHKYPNCPATVEEISGYIKLMESLEIDTFFDVT